MTWMVKTGWSHEVADWCYITEDRSCFFEQKEWSRKLGPCTLGTASSWSESDCHGVDQEKNYIDVLYKMTSMTCTIHQSLPIRQTTSLTGRALVNNNLVLKMRPCTKLSCSHQLTRAFELPAILSMHPAQPSL